MYIAILIKDIVVEESENARTYYHYVSDNIGSICYVINSRNVGTTGVESDGLNLYAYVQNNPVRYVESEWTLCEMFEREWG